MAGMKEQAVSPLLLCKIGHVFVKASERSTHWTGSEYSQLSQTQARAASPPVRGH